MRIHVLTNNYNKIMFHKNMKKENPVKCFQSIVYYQLNNIWRHEATGKTVCVCVCVCVCVFGGGVQCERTEFLTAPPLTASPSAVIWPRKIPTISLLDET